MNRYCKYDIFGDIRMTTEKLKIILEIVKYIIGSVIAFTAGYAWGKSRGFDIGFKLGNLLTECRLKFEETPNNDKENITEGS